MVAYKTFKLLLLLLISVEVILFLIYLLTSGESYYTSFSFTYGTIALLGAIAAYWASTYWGTFKSYLGKTLLFIGGAQLALFLGQVSCNFMRITQSLDKCPYPSPAEFFFVSSIFLYILGAYSLATAMGAILSVRNRNKYKALAAFVALVMIVLALYKFTEINGVTQFKIIR